MPAGDLAARWRRARRGWRVSDSEIGACASRLRDGQYINRFDLKLQNQNPSKRWAERPRPPGSESQRAIFDESHSRAQAGQLRMVDDTEARRMPAEH